MSAIILDGRLAAQRILAGVKSSVRRLPRRPLLATIVVGQRSDSLLYARLKERAANKVGIRTVSHRLPTAVSQQKLITLINSLNINSATTGILLQLPLPSHLDTERVISSINPKKDVDGFRHRIPTVQSPLISAILHLLKMSRPRPRSHFIILARDTAFSRHLNQALTAIKFHGTISAAQSRIPPLAKKVDIIITALGRGPRLLDKHIKPGAIIIDAGIRQFEGKTTGDVDQGVYEKAKAVSPVPGGVGPLTVAYVLKNTVTLTKRK